MIRLVYFSTKSGNTRRFVEKLGFPSYRLPVGEEQTHATFVDNGVVQAPYVLVTPTYGGGHLKGAVPPQVIRFLNRLENRLLLQGVIACGDTNFGPGYCSAGPLIAQKCQVPHLANIEMFGSPDECERVRKCLIDFGSVSVECWWLNPHIALSSGKIRLAG